MNISFHRPCMQVTLFDVNHEMDIGPAVGVSTPGTAMSKVHCSREGFVFNFFS